MVFNICDIKINNSSEIKKVKTLLLKFNLKLDLIDKCFAIYENEIIIATISKYHNTIKCLAICQQYQGNNLTNKLVSKMIKAIYNQGFNEIFVVIKKMYLDIFKHLGFLLLYENNLFAFLNNRADLFKNYLAYLKSEKMPIQENSSAVVINANPFTNGHLHLIKMAQENSSFVYIIPVKEDSSLFTYEQRLTMIKKAVAKMTNIKVLAGSQYLISKSTFPAYFLKSPSKVINQQTQLDANIFAHYIAKELNIKKRFVAQEPFSKTTKKYNQTMKMILNVNRIQLIEIERLKVNHQAISATIVRKLFINGDFKTMAPLVPATTLAYLKKLNYKSYSNQANIKDIIDKDY